jgi:hypothetical protein
MYVLNVVNVGLFVVEFENVQCCAQNEERGRRRERRNV